MKHLHLPANADTVHWGYFSPKLRPQLEVEPGDGFAVRLPDAVPEEPVHAIRLDGVVPRV